VIKNYSEVKINEMIDEKRRKERKVNADT